MLKWALLNAVDYVNPQLQDDTNWMQAQFIMLICIVAFAVIYLTFIVLYYIFQNIGIYKMGKSLNLSDNWMTFIPYLNVYAFGRIAQQYVKENGKKSAKFSRIMLISNILFVIFNVVAFFVLMIINIIISETFPIEQQDAILEIAIGVWYLISGLISLAYYVFYYVVLWRIYAIFSNGNATMLLIISIFLPFVQPFLIFGLRNRSPICVETVLPSQLSETEGVIQS